jgi:hypothetical protein
MPSEGGGRRPAAAAVARSRVAAARGPTTAAWVRSVPLGLDPPLHDLPAHTHTHTQREGVRHEESHVVYGGGVGDDATLGGGTRSALLWWHPVVQGLRAASGDVGAWRSIGWWRGVRRRGGARSSRLWQCLAVEAQ